MVELLESRQLSEVGSLASGLEEQPLLCEASKV